MIAKHWYLVGALFVVGCGSGEGDLVDGGNRDASTVDAGPVIDSGPIADARNPGPDAEPPPPSSLLAPPYLMWATPTEVTVRWETQSATRGRVDYGPTAGLGMAITEPTPVTSHEVRLTGLAPGQLNYYLISYDGFAIPMESFRTAPATGNNGAFSFVVFGDNQNGPMDFATLVQHMIGLNPLFALSTGDCVQNGTRDEYRDQFFTPFSPLANHASFLIGAGNHELYSDPDGVLFDEYMSQPGDEHCFGWRWGSLFVLVIDTEMSISTGSPQRACIEAALSSSEATTATFQAAVFHKPPRVEWWGGGLLAFTNLMEAPWIREELEPVLESHGVDIVFNGHNHLYAHTPKTPGGITWVTTGGAGGSIDTDFALWKVRTWPEIETTIHEHHFLSVTVNGAVMTVRAIGIDGSELHQFTVSP